MATAARTTSVTARRAGKRKAMNTATSQATAHAPSTRSRRHPAMRRGPPVAAHHEQATPTAAAAANATSGPRRVAVNRRTSGSGGRRRPFARELGHALFEGNGGHEAEAIGRLAGRRHNVADVAQAPLAGDLGPRRIGTAGRRQRRCDVTVCPGGAAGHVVCARLHAVAGQSKHVGVSDIAHVHEVTRLAAVLKYRGCPARGQGAPEDGRHAGVGGVAGHPRAVDVVVAEGDNSRAGLAAPRLAQMLLVELGRCVHVARIGSRVFCHRLPSQLGPTPRHRAARLEAPGPQILGPPRRRGHEPVRGTAGPAVSVHDHAAGQHQPAGEPSPPQDVEEHSRARVVVGDVVGGIAEVDAQAHLCRLMADGIHVFDRAAYDRRVAYIALDQLRVRVEPLSRRTVQHSHVGTAVAEGADHMGTDEPGATGHEDLHAGCDAPSESGRRTVKRQPLPSLRTEMVPWWASTSPRATARPRPAPALPGVRAASPRYAISKTWSRSFAGIPPHASRTDTTAAAPLSSNPASIHTVPPAGVWRMALSRRLRTTRAISGVDRSTTGDGSPTAPLSRIPLAPAMTDALATASETSSSSATRSRSRPRAPASIRESSKRSSTRPERRSTSRCIVR